MRRLATGLLALALLAASCGGSQESAEEKAASAWRSVRVGMTEDEVRAVLGERYLRQSWTESLSLLYYSFQSGTHFASLVLFFENGRLSGYTTQEELSEMVGELRVPKVRVH